MKNNKLTTEDSFISAIFKMFGEDVLDITTTSSQLFPNEERHVVRLSYSDETLRPNVEKIKHFVSVPFYRIYKDEAHQVIICASAKKNIDIPDEV